MNNRYGTILARWQRPTARPLADLTRMRVFGVKHMGMIDTEFEQPVINWGCSSNIVEIPSDSTENVPFLNIPEAVAKAANKLETFRQWNSYDFCPEYTNQVETAQKWLENGNSVVVRELLCASAGRGMSIINKNLWKELGKPPIVQKAPLYTRYFRKDREIRVHLFNGTLVALAEKLRRQGEPADYWIRSHDRGWIFADLERRAFDEELLLHILRNCAIALRALDLDFGAIDVGIKSDGTYKFFEVNTAPGLTGQTLEKWAKLIKVWLKDVSEEF